MQVILDIVSEALPIAKYEYRVPTRWTSYLLTFSTAIAKSCGTVPLSHAGMIPAAWDGWKEFLRFTK
jgi:hypothetical protein